MTMATGDDDNNVDGDSAMGNKVDDDGARWATTMKTTTMGTTMTMAMATAQWAAARQDRTRTTMAMGDDDNDVDGDGATGNKRGGGL